MSHPALGRFVWYDLMTSDQTASKAFYNQLIGWGTKLWEDSDMAYTMWTRADSPSVGSWTCRSRQVTPARRRIGWPMLRSPMSPPPLCARKNSAGSAAVANRHPGSRLLRDSARPSGSGLCRLYFRWAVRPILQSSPGSERFPGTNSPPAISRRATSSTPTSSVG